MFLFDQDDDDDILPLKTNNNHNNKTNYCNKRPFIELLDFDNKQETKIQPSPQKKRKLDDNNKDNKNVFNFLNIDLISSYAIKQVVNESNEIVNAFENCYMTNYKIYGEIESIDTFKKYKTYIILLKNNNLKGKCTCSSLYYWCKHMIALGITFIEANEIFIYKQSDKKEQEEEEGEEEKEEKEEGEEDRLKYITYDKISILCTDVSWSRAQDYVNDFIECRKSNDSIFGTINGRSWPMIYSVSIRVKSDQELDGECNCPSHHYWCKHIGALGLTFFEFSHKFKLIQSNHDNDNNHNNINHDDDNHFRVGENHQNRNLDLEDDEENWLLNLV